MRDVVTSMRNNEKRNINNEIDRIQVTIEELQQQLADLRLIVEIGQQQEGKTKHRRRRDIQVGDRVRVLNNYRGLRNTTGVVISISATQATVRSDRDDIVFRKYKQNLEIVEEVEDE